ncbi:MAG: hypothetical protein K9G41_03200 [Flavobacteriales bacterium]|nr:hypothetical protein [Flavobacteriales bacterium]
MNKATQLYRVTGANHLANAWVIVFYLGGAALVPFYMISKYGMTNFDSYLFVSLVLFLIFFIPVCIIHLSYYLTNRGDTLVYSPNDQYLEFNRKGQIHRFFIHEIERVNRFMSWPLAERRSHWLPWDNNNYSEIILKDGRQFIVTSLLVPNLNLQLNADKVFVHKRVIHLARTKS